MRFALMAAALMLAGSAHAEGYVRSLDEATPAAADLIRGKAHDWRQAPAIVKDRAGDMIFEAGKFPYKSEMNSDDMIACLDELALKSDAGRTMDTMIAECGGVPGFVDVD